MKIVFLTLDEAIALHADQIERYGGRPGIRDLSLLQTAVGVPSATFEGRFLHEGLHEMAASYLDHVVRKLCITVRGGPRAARPRRRRAARRPARP
jgi:death on curing protein